MGGWMAGPRSEGWDQGDTAQCAAARQHQAAPTTHPWYSAPTPPRRCPPRWGSTAKRLRTEGGVGWGWRRGTQQGAGGGARIPHTARRPARLPPAGWRGAWLCGTPGRAPHAGPHTAHTQVEVAAARGGVGGEEAVDDARCLSIMRLSCGERAQGARGRGEGGRWGGVMHPPCSQPDWPSHVCPHALPPPHSPHTHTHTTHLAQVVLRLSQEDVVVAVRPNQRDLGAAGGGGGGCALRRLRTRAADPAAPQAAGPGAPPHLFGPLQGLHHLYRVHNPLDRHQLRLRLRTPRRRPPALPPLASPPSGGSATVRAFMAGMTVLLRGGGDEGGAGRGGGRAGGRCLCACRCRMRPAWGGHNRAATPPISRPPPLCHTLPRLKAHLSGMLRMRWLNSLRADMVRPLAGWCAASRMSWSQNELISAAGRGGWGGAGFRCDSGCGVGARQPSMLPPRWPPTPGPNNKARHAPNMA